MRTAVDLDQLAEPRPACAELIHALRPAPLRPPQAEADLHLPQRLGRHRDPLDRRKLFGRERGAEPLVFPLQEFDDPRPTVVRHTVVRRPAPLPRRQPTIPARRQAQTRRLTCRLPIPRRSAASRCRNPPRHSGAPKPTDLAPTHSSSKPRRASVPRRSSHANGDMLTLLKGDIPIWG